MCLAIANADGSACDADSNANGDASGESNANANADANSVGFADAYSRRPGPARLRILGRRPDGRLKS